MHGFLMGHPHQEMLLILAEQGAVGLLVYLILLVALARYISRLDPPEQGIYASILLIYLVAGLANGLWADFTHRNVFVLLLACIPMVTASSRPVASLSRSR
jgi:O-antigen ligase